LQGNIVKFIIEEKANHYIVDSLISKFSFLKPLELKTEYENNAEFDVSELDFEFKGVNVKNDMTEFVNSLEDIESPEQVNNYLTDVFERAEPLIK
jgi:hypothetical protein